MMGHPAGTEADVQIVRFDEELSLRPPTPGGRFSIGPLTNDARVRVQLLYLPAGGLIPRHPAVGRQLLAVVVGEGWVSGADGVRRPVRAGWGAVVEDDEPHETGSDTGLTAVCVEGAFETWATTVTTDIVVADYDPRWPDWYDEVSRYVWPAVEDRAVRIDHVGSTSVPGLAAKPIIDLDVVVAADDDVRPAIDALAAIGYRWRGELGVEGRQAFSLTGGHAELPAHHL